MLYWKYSPNRIFFVNEYWLFIPLALAGNYFIIRKIRLNKERMKELEKLQKQLEREQQIRRIALFGCGLTGCIHLLTRGGALDFVDVDYIREKCGIEEGVPYLDNPRLRKIINDLYRYKRKGKIIYITATALCHIANIYGLMFLDLPFAIGDFGLTNIYQTFRKALVTLLLGGIGPAIIVGGPGAYTVALILATSGLRLAFINLDFIPTSPIDEMVPITDLKPRIPGQGEVVVVNVNKVDKITMKPVQENPECWLPEQHVLNPNCHVKPTEISGNVNSISTDLKYDQTVNMQDVTHLHEVEFSDKFDLGQIKSSGSNLRKGKQVNFLDKFGDPEIVDETWNSDNEAFRVPEKRLRNK